MYSSIYSLQSSTQRLPIQALFGFMLKATESYSIPSFSEFVCVGSWSFGLGLPHHHCPQLLQVFIAVDQFIIVATTSIPSWGCHHHQGWWWPPLSQWLEWWWLLLSQWLQDDSSGHCGCQHGSGGLAGLQPVVVVVQRQDLQGHYEEYLL